ncbi:hypothetical protein CO615_03315 [Lysobacteraceae bacterium NML75-0749]|nr:hypothetical protein CO615_03315 [Xanthomonadaceae bacterium NML75-0749]
MNAHLNSVELSDIAQALGITYSAAKKRAAKLCWNYTEQSVRGGKKRFYPVASLPEDVRTALAVAEARAQVAEAKAKPEAKAAEAAQEKRIASAWEKYHLATDDLRARAVERAAGLDAIARLVAGGMATCAARAQVAAEINVSPGSLSRWAADVRGVNRADWPAVLLPAYCGNTTRAECSEEAWDWYKGHYLSRGKPSAKETYRRLKEMAGVHGWVIPSESALRERLKAEVDRTTIVIRREGEEAGRMLLPTVHRNALSVAAGEVVNGDGLKLDSLWVRFEDGEVLNTATIWFWQDVRTRRILAWRLGKSENTDVFRLATYDLTAICAPEHYVLDNTRVAANKLMTGGAHGRHRFKTDPDDPPGLLMMIGGQVHFTNPSKTHGNPGAKPIERAFASGGLHEKIRTNPSLKALKCYSKGHAADVEVIRAVVAEEVARFNAQTQRRTEACRGVLSFDQAWAEGIAQQAPRQLAERQRDLLLTCREVVTADRKNGTLQIRAGGWKFGKNRYWCEALPQYAGERLVVHYDPENLHSDVHVYRLDGRYLLKAEYQAGTGFLSTDAGRQVAKERRRLANLNKAVAESETRMNEIQRAALYADRELPPPVADTPDDGVLRPVFGRTPSPKRDEAEALEAPLATGTDDQRMADLNEFLRIQAEARKNRI